MVKLTEREKQALQLLIDNAEDVDEDNGVITYFTTFRNDIDEKQIPGFRGVCSSLIQKGVIDKVDNYYCNTMDIPEDENGKVIFDIEEDLNMQKNYVWKHFPGSEDWGLFPRGTKELEEDTAIVILSRQNRYFPWSVYIGGKEDKDALDGCESDSTKDVKEYILKNLDNILDKKNESLKESTGKKYYEIETGVLLDPEDKEYDAYKMDGVYDGEHSFYDIEQFALDIDPEEYKKDLLNKLERWSGKPYAIIKGPFEAPEDVNIDEIEEFSYDINDVVFSAYKDEDGNIVYNFLEGEDSHEEDKLDEKIVRTIKDLDDDIYIEHDVNEDRYYLASDYDRYVWTNFKTIQDAEDFYKYHKNDVRNSILEETLTEAPDDDGIMSDDELDAEDEKERAEFEARLKARRDKVAQQRADRDAKKSRDAELKSQAQEKLKEINNDWSFEHVFDVLVPDSGKCDSLAGEIIRAINKIEYRWFNDGDRFNEDYGIETCGQPAYFLAQIEVEDGEPFWDLILDVDKNGDDDEYERMISNLKDKAIELLKAHNELLALDTKDMYDIDTRDVERFLDEYNLIPKYDYDAEIPQELQAHLDKGNIDERDLIWEVQSWIENMGNSTNDVSIDWGNVYIYDLSKADYDELEGNLYKWLEEYASQLTEEYGDPFEEEEEEEPEEESENESLEEEKLDENKVLDDMADSIETLLKDNKIPSPYIDINKNSIDVGANDEEHLNKIKELLSSNGYSHLENISGGAPKYYGVRIGFDCGPTHGYATMENYERSQAILDEMSKLRNDEGEQESKLLKAWAQDKVISDEEFTKKIKKLHKEIQDKEDALYKELCELHEKDKELRNK